VLNKKTFLNPLVSNRISNLTRTNIKMENSDKEKIERIIKTRKKAHSFYSGKSKGYQSFIDMEQKTYKDGKLSKLQKELIAIGISIVTDCESCME
jgi:alkylhydroperoxidase/carboxymuconolactone decarboxylase family protein YurZ